MKPRYAVRKTMLVIATFAFLLGGTGMFYATAPHAEGAKTPQKAKSQKAQPMVLVYDTTKSAGTTITLPIIGRAGQRIGKANVTGSNDAVLFTTPPNHGLKNGQEIWLSGTNDIDTTKPYRVTNAQKNTFMLIEMNKGAKGTGFDPGKKFNMDAEGTVGVHKAVLPDVTIQWGDGKTTRMTTSGLAKHTYGKKGKYVVTITGRLPQLGWGAMKDDEKSRCVREEDTKRIFPGIEKLVAVQSFGALDTHSLSGAFAGAVSLTAVPETLPATVTDISFLFNGAKTLNDNIAQWNTANVTNMSAMFCGASAFNQPLAQWNVSNVRDMGWMFKEAKSFNQPLEQWNVSQVTNMEGMFAYARFFNQPLAQWNVSNVTYMGLMFYEATSFNQPLEKWNVSQVTDMGAMFNSAKSFNQPLAQWNVTQVTDMGAMFSGAKSFNQPLAQWNVSKVTNMDWMFYEATSFNQPLAQWNVSQVKDMYGMFWQATAFNQPLAQWSVSQVTDMGAMFFSATAFNQPLDQWNVSNVTDMNGMFSVATSFNQPLEKWNVSNVTDMNGMFSGAKSFDQDLSRWCVRAIKTEPAYFSTDASNWKKAKPPWGTCP